MLGNVRIKEGDRLYCVIQEVERKTESLGSCKSLKVHTTTNGIAEVRYGYSHSDERFIRPIKKAYKISIHKSYRENGKVKKKQYSICTIGYYDFVEFGIEDFASEWRIKDTLHELQLTYDELMKLVYNKCEPLIKQIKEEYQATEEYRAVQEQRKIIDKYNTSKNEFESLYGYNTYDYCYDIFGTLRNEDMLNRIKKQYENYQEKQNSYYEDFKSNYNQYDFGSLSGSSNKTYSDDEKKYLKKIYKAAAMVLHPDKAGGSDEGMQFLNKLKEEWNI